MTCETVIISADEYRDLLALKAAITGPQIVSKVPSRGFWEDNPEVALFLSPRFGKMRMDALLDECCSRFGWKKTPSRSAAYRYWMRLRNKAGESELYKSGGR